MSEQPDAWAQAGERIGGVGGAALGGAIPELLGGGPEDPLADIAAVRLSAAAAQAGGELGEVAGQDLEGVWDDITDQYPEPAQGVEP